MDSSVQGYGYGKKNGDAPKMIERSSNIPPEAIVHSNADLNLPEHYDAGTASDMSLPEHYDAKNASDMNLPEHYEPMSSPPYEVREKMNPFVDPEPDRNPAHEKQIYSRSAFNIDDKSAQPVADQRRYFGLRPKMFFLCFGGLLLVIIAAAVGGGVGGSMASKNKKDAVTSANSGSGQPTATTTATGTSSTSSSGSTTVAGNTTSTASNTTTLIRGLAATEVNTNIFLTHQDDAGDLYVLPYYNTGGGWKEKSQLTLKTPAMVNTSLVSMCWNSSNVVDIRTYYIATNSLLQEIAISCNANGTGCTNSSGALQGNIKLNPNAGLAGVTVGKSLLRLFTLDDEGNISELQYNTGTGWGALTSIGSAQADPLSPLAVVANGAVMYLFWFTSARALQFSKYGSSWSTPTTLATVSSIPASLTAALSPSQGTIQVFYPDGTGFQEVKYSSGTWASSSDSLLPASSMADGPVAAVGWNGTTATRVYYMANGTFQEIEPDGKGGWEDTTGWKASFLGY